MTDTAILPETAIDPFDAFADAYTDALATGVIDTGALSSAYRAIPAGKRAAAMTTLTTRTMQRLADGEAVDMALAVRIGEALTTVAEKSGKSASAQKSDPIGDALVQLVSVRLAEKAILSGLNGDGDAVDALADAIITGAYPADAFVITFPGKKSRKSGSSAKSGDARVDLATATVVTVADLPVGRHAFGDITRAVVAATGSTSGGGVANHLTGDRSATADELAELGHAEQTDGNWFFVRV